MSKPDATPDPTAAVDPTTTIDADAVIQRLANRIAQLEVQNAMLLQQAEALRQAMREAPNAGA